MKNLICKTGNFMVKVFDAAKDRIMNFVQKSFDHIEAVFILVAASIGISVLLTNVIDKLIDMSVSLEVINVPMITPVLAVLIVLLLLESAECKAKYRGTRTKSQYAVQLT